MMCEISCHPERSEGSRLLPVPRVPQANAEIPRFARDDNAMRSNSDVALLQIAPRVFLLRFRIDMNLR